MKRIPATLGALFLLLLLTVASCTSILSDEPTADARAISFMPAAETRAAVTGKSLPDGSSFLVWGGYGDNASSINATNVFDGETVTESNGAWDYTGGTRYWMAGKTYNFYAVYPVVLPAGAVADVSTDGTITVTNFDCSKTGTEAVDLMTATATGNGSSPAPVALTFNHELARVTCDVKSVNSAATVSSVKLYGVQYKGNLTGPEQWNGQEACSLADTPFKNEEEFVLNADNQFSCTNALGDLLLLPQTFGQDVAAGFQLTYRYNGDQADRTATASIPVGTDWTAGQSYKYTITLKAAQLSLEVTVQEWDEKETSVSW